MIVRHTALLALLWSFPLQWVSSSDDPLFWIRYSGIEGTDYKYVWAIHQSRLAALPHFDPSVTEVPVSPHQAIVAATEFTRTQFPASVHLTPNTVTLLQRGIEKNPVRPALWMYEIDFLADPFPPGPHQDLLTVMILMDGKVVVPTKQPVK
jgi:hypothetical protein